MSEPVVVERSDASLRLEAMVTGTLFLLNILTGAFAQGFVNNRLVTADATTTAANILAHQGLFQLAFAVYLIEMACQVAVTALFYDLLKPVNRNVSLVAAFLSLTGIAIKTFGRVFFIAPLMVLGSPSSLAGFSVEQLRSLALLFLHLSDRAAEMGLVFFGMAAFLKGYLTYRSTFWPGFLGVLSMLGGVGWTAFLYPPLAYRVFPIILGIGLIGSAVLIVWLLVKGVDAPRWREKARGASA